MTVNERIIQALEPLGLPVTPDRYGGEEDTYLVFNHGSRGAVFGDDQPECDVRMVQVHLYAPYGRNTVGLCREIRRRLFAAGFTWPEETDAGAAYQSEKAGRHVVFECEIEEGVELYRESQGE